MFHQCGEDPEKLLARPTRKLRGRTSHLLVEGNDKLGGLVWAFSIPAARTCPGMTPCCARECYARQSRFRFPAVKAALRRNLAAARREDFAWRMAREIAARNVRTLRVHVAGDFFAPAYVGKWVGVARACPGVRFFAYTRSWRVEAIRGPLEVFASLPNVRLWYSADRDTGPPPAVPDGVRVAWLETEADEEVPDAADLVFRPRRLRKTPNPRVPLPLVCPADADGPGKVTCGSCGECWR